MPKCKVNSQHIIFVDMKFIETSALEAVNVTEAFEEIVHDIYELKQKGAFDNTLKADETTD